VRETLFFYTPFTLSQAEMEIEDWNNRADTILLTVCEKESGNAVGQTAFVRIDPFSRAAVFYLALYDSSVWNKGYGSQVTRLMIQYAFHTLNLNRIQLHVAVENTYAVKAYQNAGFIIEGTLRQAMFHNGKFADFYVMGILKEDYKR
jgi:RimJ/RimL family protein N-acetyltransferase